MLKVGLNFISCKKFVTQKKCKNKHNTYEGQIAIDIQPLQTVGYADRKGKSNTRLEPI